MKALIAPAIASLLIVCPKWADAQTRMQAPVYQVSMMASGSPGVTISTSGGVTFSAGNPTFQPITAGQTSLVATVNVANPKNANTWNLTIRGAGSNFTGTSGSPISITNVQWSASSSVTSGTGSVSTGSGQTLTTSDVVVASGVEGNKGPFTVQVTFTLTVNNSWNYDADTYLQNLVLTANAN